MSRRWPPPTYEMTCEEGLPHERQFTIACCVFKYREVGSGKSKKLAKRQAAHKMWEKLQDASLDPSQIGYEDEVRGHSGFCVGLKGFRGLIFKRSRKDKKKCLILSVDFLYFEKIL